MKTKIISLILAIALCCSFISACGDPKSSDKGKPSTPNYSATHDFTNTIIENKYIVEDGATRYQIVVPNNPSEDCLIAAKEFVQFFNEATGIQLSMITEDATGLTHDASQYYISIGNTKLFQSIELEKSAIDKNNNGIRIVTEDNNIYIYSPYSENVIFGVYDLLQILFNYEYYSKDCWEIDKNVKNLNLRNFNVIDIPDYVHRSNTWNCLQTSDDPMAKWRFRFNSDSAQMPIGDLEAVDADGNKVVERRRTVHNTEPLLPRKAVTTEDKWKGDDPYQLCYTAHGDAESYDRMTTKAAEVISQSLIDYPREQYPSYIYASISAEDYNTSCGCKWCNEAAKLYGAKSGAGIKFCNDVMKKLREWMELPENEPYKRDTFYLLFMAYFAYKAPPAHYDEAQGKYVSNHPDCQPREDVGVYYAQDGISYITSLYDSRNKNAYDRLVAWQDLTPNFSYWTYENDYVWQVGFWDTFGHYDTKGYSLYNRAGNVLDWYSEVGGNEGMSSFWNLKIYLASKLTWDCTLDSDKLTDKYFKAMFGEIAPEMREFFDDARYYSNYVLAKQGTHNGHGFYVSVSKSDWSLTTVNRWISIFDKAYEKLERIYKVALPEEYAKIKHHIDMEYVFPASYVIDCFSVESYGERYMEIVKYLQSINDEIGQFSYSHTESMGSWNDKWMSINVEG